MIGSSLIKHLSLTIRQTTHKHANKRQNLFYSVVIQMRQEEKESLTHCCPSKLVSAGEKGKKVALQRNKMSVGHYANCKQCWNRSGRHGDIRLKARRYSLLAEGSIRFVSCPFLHSPLSSSPLPAELNWPPEPRTPPGSPPNLHHSCICISNPLQTWPDRQARHYTRFT